MKAKWLLLAVVALLLAVAPSVGFAAPPTILTTQSTAFNPAVPNLGITTSSNGELGLYLVGDWDVNTIGLFELVTVVVRLVNPVSTDKWAFVTWWDEFGTGLLCNSYQLTPNTTATDTETYGSLGFSATRGAIKVLVTNDSGNPDLGLVGYRRTQRANCSSVVNLCDVTSISESEIRLQPISPKVVFSDKDGTAGPDEIAKIKTLCGQP